MKIQKSKWRAIGMFILLISLIFLCSGCYAFVSTIVHDIKYRNDSVEFYYEIEDFDLVN